MHLRASSQLRTAREGYARYGDRYPQRILFIAGLPKSGSTWVERMVASYPGFAKYLMPDVARHELATGGSHDFELSRGCFDDLGDALVLTKMHVHGSPGNVSVLAEAGLRYVVLHRDLRDVAVSYHFYVQHTPWHPEHPRHRGRSVQEGLEVFADRMLNAYVAWVRSWLVNADPAHSLQVRYEDLLVDPVSGMEKIARLFELDDSPETIAEIVKAHSFKRMSGGRDRGDGSSSAFARKGVAGDWKNHFTSHLRSRYGELIADFLVETGDEPDDTWIKDDEAT